MTTFLFTRPLFFLGIYDRVDVLLIVGLICYTVSKGTTTSLHKDLLQCSNKGVSLQQEGGNKRIWFWNRLVKVTVNLYVPPQARRENKVNHFTPGP
jgi:hypothetical protein